MKKLLLLFTTIILIFTFLGSVLPAAAEENKSSSAEEQIPSSEANATPLKNADGEEIAFEVGESSSGNSTGGIVFMIGIFGICLLLCADGLYSFIKKSKKRRAEMFESVDRE